MRTFLAIASLIAIVSSAGAEIMPLIEVHEVRSLGEIPTIDITFPNGMKDSIVLERFYPSKESRMATTPSCNFFGHLLNDKTACVSVTGCAGQDNMEFTINSVNSGPSNMYILHKNGDLEMVESAFKDERIRSETMRGTREEGGFHLKGDDQMVNDAELADLMKFREMCASGDCKAMPSKQKMQIKIHYDDTFKSDTSDVTGYINSMITQLQAHMCQISLGTQIRIEAIDGYSYEAGESWEADGETLDGPVYDITAASNSNADLHVFLCKDTEFYGAIGIAWVGSLCKTNWYGGKAGINEKRQNVLATSEVVAHEMGHNMGMDHDFDESHGGSNGPCNGKGIMSYGSAPNVWSTCSRADFLALYNQIMASSSYNWCLTKDNTACGGTAPPPPPPTTASPPIPTGDLLIGPNDVGGQCPSSTYQYNAPGICSDGCCCCGPNCCWDKCDYAPADCIRDVENSEWRYVEELGYYRAFRKSGGTTPNPTPNPSPTPTPTPGTCEDKWKAKKCNKMKKKGKCGKTKVKKNCKKTCGIC